MMYKNLGNAFNVHRKFIAKMNIIKWRMPENQLSNHQSEEVKKSKSKENKKKE